MRAINCPSVTSCMYLSIRSKKETDRLHRMNKPERKTVDDDLPSLNSDDEDGDEAWSSGVDLSEDEESDSGSDPEGGLDDEDEDSESSSSSIRGPRRKHTKEVADDEEMSYEAAPRQSKASWNEDKEKDKGISRLPIKLADGHIQKSKSKVFLEQDADSDEDPEEEEEPTAPPEDFRVEDVSTGARFGRPAVVDVVLTKSRKARIQAAKEQIAGICQEIVSDPENSVCATLSYAACATYKPHAHSWVCYDVSTPSLCQKSPLLPTPSPSPTTP